MKSLQNQQRNSMLNKIKKHRLQYRSKSTSERDLTISEDDLVGQLDMKEGSALWLGRFTTEEIEAILERSGILPSLRKMRLTDLFVEIEPLEDFGQTLKVYCRQKSPNCLLAEVRLREITFQPEEKMPESFSQSKPKMLAIDWLMMQNPFADFTPERQKLPGQMHPGLGQAHKVMKLLHTYCRWQGLTALVNFPEYFHNAYLYRAYFQFYNPMREAMLAALYRDLRPLTLAQMSWAIEWRCVQEPESGEVFDWFSGIQMMPIMQEIKDYFSSQWYREKTRRWISQKQFVLDNEKFKRLCQKNCNYSPRFVIQ